MCEERHDHMPKSIGKYIAYELYAWELLKKRFDEMESNFKEKKENNYLPLLIVEALRNLALEGEHLLDETIAPDIEGFFKYNKPEFIR